MNLRLGMLRLPTKGKRWRLLAGLITGGIVVVALMVSVVSYALAVTPSFPDVPASNPYYAAITDLAGRGIITGYTNGNFGPNDPVIRQQFAKMVVLTGGYPVSEADVCHFIDVVNGGPATLYPDNYIAVAAANGITTGKTPTTFDPYAYISRYQVISMVVRMADNLQPGLLGTPPPGFVATDGWGDDPIHGANARRAEFNGLLIGLDLAHLNPYGNMSRGEVAQVLHNLLAVLTPPTTTTSSTTTTTAATTTTSSTTTTTSSTTTTTIFGGGQGKIAFVSNRSGNAEIWVFNGALGTLANLTNNPAIDDWPDWSPDGSMITFTRIIGSKPNIYVMSANGSFQTNITPDAFYDSNPSWSPDGTRIAFDTDRAGGALQVWIMNSNGTGLLQLTNTPQLNSSPDWSPDGNRICFESERTGTREIWVMNADGTSPVRLTFTDNNYLPKWSPDGSRIVFGGLTGIWSIKPDGTGLTQLTVEPMSAFDGNPAWSPDSSKVIFNSTRSGNFDLWIMNADGSGLAQFTNNAALDAHAAWR